MSGPVLIVNFKAYAEAVGANAVSLAKACERVSKSSGVEIIFAVQTADIKSVSSAIKLPVFAEHVDAVLPGQFTGHVLAESVLANGASGTLINHSERRLALDVVALTVERCKKLGLRTVVCAKDATEAGRVATLRPDFVAYEPPELIGGSVSVSSARPEVVKRAVEKIGGKSVCIVGAGVKSGKDVSASLRLGASGVLVASGVVLAKKPENALMDLVSGF